MTAGLKCLPQNIEIPVPVGHVSQEVKYCAIMPDRIGARRFKLTDIGFYPRDQVGGSTKSSVSLLECAGSNVQNTYILKTSVEQVVDKSRRASANIQDRVLKRYVG